MIYFHNDYSEGCHEKVLAALTRTNLEQTPGYGEDHYCAEAADLIRKECNAPIWWSISWWAAPRPT